MTTDEATMATPKIVGQTEVGFGGRIVVGRLSISPIYTEGEEPV